MAELIPLHRDVLTLPIHKIVEPEFQLRIYYDEEKLLELANSMEAEGMFYPLMVSERGDGTYEVHAGSRRLRAARLKKYDEVPAVIVHLDGPAHALQLALAENLQHQDLDPFEEARGFLRLVYEYGMSQKEVAESLKQSEAFIRKRLALLSLPESVQDRIASGELGLHYVSTLVKLPTGEEQAHYANLAVDKNLTQSEMREFIAKDQESEVRVATKGISVEKIVARVAIQKRWFRKITDKVNFRNMSAEERRQIASELQGLETILRTTREFFATEGVKFAERTTVPGGIQGAPNNHGQEWTTRDIARITANDRPSDKVLARELGRTTGAIAVMRSKMGR
jgi:ParB/RepB/Spo0J family partition protein